STPRVSSRSRPFWSNALPSSSATWTSSPITSIRSIGSSDSLRAQARSRSERHDPAELFSEQAVRYVNLVPGKEIVIGLFSFHDRADVHVDDALPLAFDPEHADLVARRHGCETARQADRL